LSEGVGTGEPTPTASSDDGDPALTACRRRLRELVDPERGRISSLIFGHPLVHRLEMARIFSRCWLLAGHESEVPEPGDYVTRYLGEQNAIVVRSEDGAIRVLLNMCRHRGMRVCRADLGNASHFRCPYHGFTYRNTGELTGVPLQEEAYGGALDKSELGLVEARTETYGGLIFASWAPDPPPLDAYLGDMTWYLDLFVRRAPMEVIGPPHRWEMAADWKLPAENFIGDSYHTMHTHGSIPKLGLVSSIKFAKDGYHIYAGNGHGAGIGLPAPEPIFPSELIELFRENLGAEQWDVLRQVRNVNATVFPNLSFLISSMTLDGEVVSHTTMRTWVPQAPGRIVIYSWCLVERDAPDAWKERSRRAHILSFGPSGMFEQDDSENWTDITRNSVAAWRAGREGVTFPYLQGLHKEQVEFAGPGEVYESKFSDANARRFYRWWLDLVTE
jgi:phenylpropionate dioxygenase-like ring-hydroxylating dioxygenase large terminal subunit